MSKVRGISPLSGAMEFSLAYNGAAHASLMAMINGCHSHMVTATYKRKVWQFPKDRFIQYDQSDEEWCRYFKIGKEVEVTDTIEIPNAEIVYISDVEMKVIAHPQELGGGLV